VLRALYLEVWDLRFESPVHALFWLGGFCIGTGGVWIGDVDGRPVRWASDWTERLVRWAGDWTGVD
jgi:hypothetical protein